MEPNKTSALTKANILVVEDDPDFRNLIKKHLEKFGYSVDIAEDGEKALKLLEKEDFRILLTDMAMPNLSGMDLIKSVRARTNKPYVYIIVVSAYAATTDIVKGIGVGADDYLSKPLSFAELEARIRIGQRMIDLETRLVNSVKEQAELAKKDYLTGLYNRRHIYDLGNHLFEQGRRYGHKLSVSVVDVDKFKGINDSYGHAVGDEALLGISRHIEQTVRNVDILGRMGGEEFIVLMPETGNVGAMKVGERIRERIARNPLKTTGPTLQLTISQGIATQSNQVHSLESLIDRADVALFTAKREGRNRISVSP
jgi:diguanylate cyclase (GGDEF)-like protein